MRIIFMGTPAFAAEHLQALLDHPDRYEVAAVLTGPDKPQGRNRHVLPTPVKEIALAAAIPVLQPVTLAEKELLPRLVALRPDCIVVVAYGFILRKNILDIPRFGCINIHASLLPELRGASPIQSALLHGKTQTGVTSMRMDAGVDTGRILLQREIPIDPDDDCESLTRKLSRIGKACLLETLDSLTDTSGPPDGRLQDNRHATYAGKIRKEMACLDFNKSASALHNQVRALNAWPVCHVHLPGPGGAAYDLKVLRTEVVDTPVTTKPPPPGTVVLGNGATLAIQTGSQCLQLVTVQLPGKKPIPVRDFLNGHKIQEGCLAVSLPKGIIASHAE